MYNKLIAEGIGSYFLYLIIGLCIVPPGLGNFTPLVITIGLTALVYSCGHLSKAHFNPATTFTYMSAGTHPLKESLPYLAVIYVAMAAAAGSLYLLVPETIQTVTAFEPNLPRALFAEFLFTVALMWIILNVAIAKKNAGNNFYGIAIGFIVGAGIFTVGGISFAAFNPAVTFALCLNGFLPWEILLPYTGIQILAAVVVGRFFKSLNITDPEEFPSKS